MCTGAAENPNSLLARTEKETFCVMKRSNSKKCQVTHTLILSHHTLTHQNALRVLPWVQPRHKEHRERYPEEASENLGFAEMSSRATAGWCCRCCPGQGSTQRIVAPTSHPWSQGTGSPCRCQGVLAASGPSGRAGGCRTMTTEAAA